jgi:hypothetical protein
MKPRQLKYMRSNSKLFRVLDRIREKHGKPVLVSEVMDFAVTQYKNTHSAWASLKHAENDGLIERCYRLTPVALKLMEEADGP